MNDMEMSQKLNSLLNKEAKLNKNKTINHEETLDDLCEDIFSLIEELENQEGTWKMNNLEIRILILILLNSSSFIILSLIILRYIKPKVFKNNKN